MLADAVPQVFPAWIQSLFFKLNVSAETAVAVSPAAILVLFFHQFYLCIFTFMYPIILPAIDKCF